MARARIVRRIARALAAERGFTLIELMVAALIMVIGLLALVSGLDHSRDLVSRSEKIETATHQAEEAIERALSLRYDRVALTSTPVHSSDQRDPRHYVTGSSYQWDQGPTGPQSEPLVVDSGLGQVSGAPVPWQDSDSRLKGSIHQFVTLTGDRCLDTVSGCPSGSQPAKRVTVAVTVDGSNAPKPVLISTLMIDPAATG
jgi:prepilin-type N-terminal cleavage/methylation domain-containing protein